ncbi:MAG: hypothetical protein ACK5QW_03940 [Cyanobacteriota bacterium]
MALIPRWRFMTDEAKAISKRMVFTTVVLVVVLLIFRSLLPWAIAGLAVWWIWKTIAK